MKIIAILLNPTIDQIYEIENFAVGGTFKVKESIIYPVGKAISFALGVQELSTKHNILKVIACIGQQDIPLYTSFLNSKKIDFEFVEVKGKTRSNKTFNDPINKTTTHIREKGFRLKETELLQFENLIKNNVRKGNICVFSGSLPPNLDSYYFNLIQMCKTLGGICVLDTSGPALIEGFKASPTIIKPNLLEFSQILGKPDLNNIDLSDPMSSIKVLIDAAKPLLVDDLKIILLTLGEKGAVFITKDLILYGYAKIKEIVDTVGSGDSFLAGFILNYLTLKDLTECFTWAIASGSANAQIPGPGIFKKETVEKILKEVKIERLD